MISIGVFPRDIKDDLKHRRAAQIMEIMKEYDIVLDFHQTTAKQDDVIITQYSTGEKRDSMNLFRSQRLILGNKYILPQNLNIAK